MSVIVEGLLKFERERTQLLSPSVYNERVKKLSAELIQSKK